MRAALVGLVAVVVSGCTFGVTTCESSSECGDGTCVEGFCVAADAGSGGGTGGGMGGGVGGGGGADSGMGGGTGGTDGGSDGGSDAGTGGGGGTVMCSPLCEDSYECRAPGDGGATGECELAFERLEVLAPDGGTFGPDASVPVVARLVRKAGFSAAAPSFVELALDGMALSGRVTGDGGYAGQVSTLGLTEGAHTVTVLAVFADAGLSGTGAFTVDATGPTLDVSAVPAPNYGMAQAAEYYPSDPDLAGAYRRDSVLEVEVTSAAADVDETSVQVEASHAPSGGSGAYSAGTPCVAAGRPFCMKYSVDLSRVPFNALRGFVKLSAMGSDRHGNRSVASGGTQDIALTRWRWATRVTNGATTGAVLGTPALTRQGQVAVGVANGSNPGLTLLAPDAGVVWRAVTEAVEASPVVGTRADGAQFVFFQRKDTSETLLAASASTGALLSGCSANLSVLSAWTPVSPALVQDGTDDVGIVGTQPRTAGFRVAGYRPFAGTCYANNNASGGAFPGNVITDGVTAYYPDDSGRLTRFDVSNPSSIGAPAQFPTSPLGTGIVKGLALFESGTQLAGGGGGGPGIGALFQFLTQSGADAGVVSGTPVTAPVITAAGEVIAGFRSSTQLELRKYTSGAVQLGAGVLTNASYSNGTPGVASPVLGKDDAVYVVTNGGYLVAASQTNLSVRYQGSTSSSVALGAVSASPTLDCNREQPASQTGVLYFATESGYVVSIIVDSKGLDDTAQWPKYQRDAQNSGNTARAIAGCP